ncbi:DUF2853 family protein [endosymbiont of unidentified scaly snail isolate Monju]|uniref:DUF2853 family protein n=1 Tax=endosymbiont of unidentified scaly snail isolate Monju TaxID=1248727 RepID=UPI0003892C58|nr:DUF2853 family protein [endosymbiont of unidentified scaly snail isolate Monju]BAN69477.1 conserved hypothetical protein [endosymbiont of unidentified scaly snail isolate Monju]
MADYLADVKRYDANADAAVVDKIVKHLGIALRSSRDAALVSCSDKSELDRVREKWAMKKLGVDADTADKVIGEVCEQMKGDRQKERVTFYYLVAQKLDKLSDL